MAAGLTLGSPGYGVITPRSLLAAGEREWGVGQGLVWGMWGPGRET